MHPTPGASARPSRGHRERSLYGRASPDGGGFDRLGGISAQENNSAPPKAASASSTFPGELGIPAGQGIQRERTRSGVFIRQRGFHPRLGAHPLRGPLKGIWPRNRQSHSRRSQRGLQIVYLQTFFVSRLPPWYQNGP